MRTSPTTWSRTICAEAGAFAGNRTFSYSEVGHAPPISGWLGDRPRVATGMLTPDPDGATETVLLQTVLDTLSVSVYLIDGGRLSYVNRKFVEMTGYTREELLALGTIQPLVLEEDRAVLKDLILRRRAGDVGPTRCVVRLRRRDRSVLSMEIRSAVALVDG